MTALQIVQKFYPHVVSVKDSHKSIAIEVTTADTKSKAVKNHKECALAVACKRTMHVDAAVICVKSAYLIHGDKAVRYAIPNTLSREITAFDRDASFEPGSYHLKSISPSFAIGIKRAWKRGPKTGKSAYFHRTENVRRISDVN